MTMVNKMPEFYTCGASKNLFLSLICIKGMLLHRICAIKVLFFHLYSAHEQLKENNSDDAGFNSKLCVPEHALFSPIPPGNT
jgi:hypothetical protein